MIPNTKISGRFTFTLPACLSNLSRKPGTKIGSIFPIFSPPGFFSISIKLLQTIFAEFLTGKSLLQFTMAKRFYYNSKKNVLDYIKVSAPYDGKVIREIIQSIVPEGACLLELGMGPGKDLLALKNNYLVTGSDISKVFLDVFREKHHHADLLQLDAVTLKAKRKFDCVYSNKVLHHLSFEELDESLKRQSEVLNDAGWVVHSFWEGDREDILSGLRFVYHRKDRLTTFFSRYFSEVKAGKYSEVFPDDSIWITGRKRIL